MEQFAVDVPVLTLLDSPVPQKVEQLVAVLARFDAPIPEQVIEVPKISCPPRFSRTVLRTPQMAEQLEEVPVPTVLDVTIMAPFVDTAGRWISRPDGVYTWWLAGTSHHQGTFPEGITSSPGQYINTGHHEAG